MLIDFTGLVGGDNRSVFTHRVNVHKRTESRHPLGNHQFNRLAKTGIVVIHRRGTLHLIHQIPFLLQITVLINADFFRRHGKGTIRMRMRIHPAAFFNNFISNKGFKTTNVTFRHSDSINKFEG